MKTIVNHVLSLRIKIPKESKKVFRFLYSLITKTLLSKSQVTKKAKMEEKDKAIIESDGNVLKVKINKTYDNSSGDMVCFTQAQKGIVGKVPTKNEIDMNAVPDVKLDPHTIPQSLKRKSCYRTEISKDDNLIIKHESNLSSVLKSSYALLTQPIEMNEITIYKKIMVIDVREERKARKCKKCESLQSFCLPCQGKAELNANPNWQRLLPSHKPTSEWNLSKEEIVFGIGSFAGCDGQYHDLVIPWFGVYDSEKRPAFFLGLVKEWRYGGFQSLLPTIDLQYHASFLDYCPMMNGVDWSHDYKVVFPDFEEGKKIKKAIIEQDLSLIVYLNMKLEQASSKENFDGETTDGKEPRIVLLKKTK